MFPDDLLKRLLCLDSLFLGLLGLLDDLFELILQLPELLLSNVALQPQTLLLLLQTSYHLLIYLGLFV